MYLFISAVLKKLRNFIFNLKPNEKSYATFLAYKKKYSLHKTDS